MRQHCPKNHAIDNTPVFYYLLHKNMGVFYYDMAEAYLETWINKSNRKPLVIRGARQVGKSTLVRQFAGKQKKTLIEINLERHLFLDDIFKTLDTDAALREIEALSGIPVTTPGAILFLDEIQSTPHALQLLRYLYEEKNHLPGCQV
jgi:predicted AAA+ superfamily ATPase